MIASLRGLSLVVGLAALPSLSTAAVAAAVARRPAAVVVAPLACSTPPVSLPAFIDALRVELAGASIRCCDADAPHVAGAPAATMRVTLGFEVCQPSAGHVSVSVADSLGGPGVRRDIDLDDVAPEARPRALALVVAELVGAGPSTSTSTSTSRSPPPSPTPASAAPAAVAVEPAAATASTPGLPSLGALQLGADFALRFYPARDTTLPGARLWLSAALGSWAIEAAVDGAAGSHDYEPGEVTVRSLAAGLTLGPRWTLGEYVAGASLGADIGWTWIAGQSTNPGVVTGSGSGATGAVRARLGIERTVAPSVRVRALIDGGVMVSPVDATVDDVRAAGTSGLFVLGSVGVGYALGGQGH